MFCVIGSMVLEKTISHGLLLYLLLQGTMVSNATLNNISVISWRSVSLV
jgi:hypothetical protein